MLASLFVLFTVTQAFPCNKQCEATCQALNGKAECFSSCFCPEITSKAPDFQLKAELASVLKLKHVCYIEDVEFCENSTRTDKEYYECLEKVKCLVYQNGPLLLETLPIRLWPAVQPSFLSFKEKGKCETCKEEYFADEFYTCVYYNCQEKITEKNGLLKFLQKNERCKSCEMLENGKNSCVWKECRKEIVNKKVLMNDEGKNMTCKECEKIVFADDYYNCIALHCNNLWNKKSFEQFQTIHNEDSDCKACGSFEDNQDFVDCARFSCKAEIFSWLNVDLARFQKDCSTLLDQEYLDCIKDETILSSLNFLVLFTAFALMSLCFMLKMSKSTREESPTYIMIS